MQNRLPSDASIPPEIARILADQQRQIDQLRTARGLESSSIGRGGLRVIGDGGITVEGGGDVTVGPGSRIEALYTNDLVAVVFGEVPQGTSNVPHGTGLYVFAADESGAPIWWSTLRSDGLTEVVTGFPGAPVAKVLSISSEETHEVFGGKLRLRTLENGDIEVLSDELLWLYGDDVVDVDCPNGPVDVDAGTVIDMDAGTDVDIRAGTGFFYAQGTTQAQMLSPSGAVAIGGGAGTFIQVEATGNAANVHMAADGRVFRNASSRRYKTDIQDLDVDPDVVLTLRPRSWLPAPMPRSCPDWLHAQHPDGECPADLPPVEPDPGARRQVGFIAEELDELGLTEFVEYNTEGEPEAIYYDRLAAALIPVVQRQQAQIDALAARLDALESA